MPAGGGAWAPLSDRNAKENFRAINTSDILSKVAQLDLSEWNYKTQDDSIRHIGPMAQDMYAAFQLGDDNISISTIDADGVLFAAVQELLRRNVELEARIKNLESGSRR